MNHESAGEMEIVQASYGKAAVRALSWVTVDGLDVPREVSLWIEVEGQFLDAYRHGDNSAILPSDTLRRHALAECETSVSAPFEELAERLSSRVLRANPAFDSVTVRGESRVWRRTGAHSFALESWRDTVEVRASRGGPRWITSGVAGLILLSTAGNGFSGFLRDELTAQNESTNRPLLGTVDATWTYAEPVAAVTSPLDMAAQIATALADRTSNAIQQLLTDAATLLLRGNRDLATLTLSFTSGALSPAPQLPPATIPTSAVGASGGTVHELTELPAGLTRVTVRRH